MLLLSVFACVEPESPGSKPARDRDGPVEDDTATDCSGSRWYADRDGDGHGDPSSYTVTCDEPAAHVLTSTDCDDTDATVHPGAPEACDAVDDDCDGEIDEDIALATWYRDADGDGFGDPAGPLLSCQRAPGTVADATDCDDTDATVHPSAPDAFDGRDADCDGAVEGFALHEVASLKIVGEFDYDVFGTSVSGGTDHDGDGIHDLAIGAPGFDDERRVRHGNCDGHQGVVYVFGGGQKGALEASDAEAWIWGDGPNAAMGSRLTWAGDLDGDGHGDLFVGAPATYDREGRGTTHLFLGPLEGEYHGADADLTMSGYWEGTNLGDSVASAGDIDGDGVGDLVASAAQRGLVVWVSGTARGLYDYPAADGVLQGRGGWAGWSVAGAGDVDADGYADLLVGAPTDDRVREDDVTGAAFLVRGPALGDVDLEAADAIVLGDAPQMEVGMSVASAGDLDGDALPDLVLGLGEADNVYAGSYLLVPGTLRGTWSATDAALARLRGREGDSAGYAATTLGDIDGDGVVELLLGAMAGPNADGARSGTAWIVDGDVRGDLDAATHGWALWAREGDMVTYSVAPAGDPDGDSRADLFIGAVGDETNGYNAGAAYVVPADALVGD